MDKRAGPGIRAGRPSIRFADGCGTIPGTSGSPVISVATGEVVGINNTANESGESCTLDNLPGCLLTRP